MQCSTFAITITADQVGSYLEVKAVSYSEHQPVMFKDAHFKLDMAITQHLTAAIEAGFNKYSLAKEFAHTHF